MKEIEYPAKARSHRLHDSTGWTSAEEVQAIIHYAKLVGVGDIIEIGCNLGEVTRELARAFDGSDGPQRTVIGVDWTAGEVTMAWEQRGERPWPGSAGIHARAFSNVRIIDAPSATLSIDGHDLKNVRTVFVDGDHSFDGVKADTELWLGHLMKNGAPWCMLWHDAQVEVPAWIGVRRYLEQLARDRFPHTLKIITGTRLAVMLTPWD